MALPIWWALLRAGGWDEYAPVNPGHQSMKSKWAICCFTWRLGSFLAAGLVTSFSITLMHFWQIPYGCFACGRAECRFMVACLASCLPCGGMAERWGQDSGK